MPDQVELKPTRRLVTAVTAAHFEHVDQGGAFATLTGGTFVPNGPVPHVQLPTKGVLGPQPQRLLVGDWLVRHGNAMWERMTDAIYRERYEPPEGEVVQLGQVVESLPDPVEFRRRLLAAMRQNYAEQAAEQTVHVPEDTFEVQLFLTRGIELCKQYASTFSDAGKELAKYQREQLELLPGGPGSIVIPDAEGDVRVQLDTSNSYSFDEGQLSVAIAAVLMPPDMLLHIIAGVEDASTPEEQESAVADRVAVLIVGAIELLRSLGIVSPQVTKVRAFADKLARDGESGLAGVVRDSIIKGTKTKDGAKFTRKEPVT